MKYIQLLNFSNVRRILNQQFQSITTAAIVISLTSLVSRFLGLIRDHMLAGRFGAGDVLDIYYASFRVPDLIYNLLVLGALSAGFIPVFINYLSVSNDNRDINANKKAWDLVNNLLNIMLIGICGLCILMIILTPYLMKYIVPGFSNILLEKTIILTQIMFLSPVFLSISGLFGGVLQSFKRFFIFSLAPIVYNLGIIIGVVYFYDLFGINGLAFGVILGAFFHMLMQIIPTLKLGYKYQFIVNLKNKGFIIILKMMIPRTLALAVTQFNLIIITLIASTLESGSLSVFNFANNLQGVPLGLFGISFAIAAFPTLSYYANEKKWDNFSKTFSSVCRQIIFFIIPVSLMFFIFRAQIVRLVLGSGNFDWNDTVLTLNALGVFSASLFAQSLIPLLARTFYSVHDSKTPFYIALFAMIVNVVLSLILSSKYNLLGLVWAFSISAVLQFVILWISLNSKVGNLREREILMSAGKIFMAAFIMAIFAQGSKYYFGSILNIDTVIGLFIQTAMSGFIAVLMFIATALFLNIKEMVDIQNSLHRKFFKTVDVPKAKIEE